MAEAAFEASLSQQASDDFLLSIDASSLSQKIENGEVSVSAVMEATLRRVHRHNAVVSLRDNCLTLAKEAESSPRKGWLHGIPIAVKDSANVAGLRTTIGGLIDEIPIVSDPFVDRLEAAGAIVIGKTNVPEACVGSHTVNTKFGPTGNSYDDTRSAGGSSGGAAVAVALHIFPVADGSDMMGSLRNPAGWNGLYSIRPTAGIMNDELETGNPLDYPLSTVGCLARNPWDMSRFLETMSGSRVVPRVPDLGRRYRVAWLGDWGGAYPMEDGILPLCCSALQCLGTVVKVEVPLFDASLLWESWTAIRPVVIQAAAKELLDCREMETLKERVKSAPLRWELEQAERVCESDLHRARTIADEWGETLERVFLEYDAVALPTAQMWPFPIEWDYPRVVKDVAMDTYHRWMEVHVPVSLAGLPCVAVPAGLSECGLPMGIQIAMPRGNDDLLLELAEVFASRCDMKQ